MKPITVLIVDDSALIRKLFSELLSDVPDIQVVGTAVDAQDARASIKRLNPDVLTLDIEMPGMDGLSFLEKIMSLRPMPVIMVSTLTQKGAGETIRALEIGAIDYISKPLGSHTGDTLGVVVAFFGSTGDCHIAVTHGFDFFATVPLHYFIKDIKDMIE